MDDMGRKTRVINVRGIAPGFLMKEPDFVYVGRANPRTGWSQSVWGNPIRVGMTWKEVMKVLSAPDGTPGPHDVIDADTAARMYTYWMSTQEKLIERLGELRGKRLGCWCTDWSPDDGEPTKACHAVTLARLADQADVFSEGKAARAIETARK